MKKHVMTLLLSCICLSAFSQGELVYTQRLFKLWTVNPAYLGGENDIRANMSYKRLWEGIEGAPRLIGANLHSPVGFYNLGAGLKMDFEDIGFRHNNRISVSGDVDIQVSYNSYLFVGLSLGADMRRYDSDVVMVSPDAASTLDNYNSTSFVEGFGLSYRWNKLIVGVGNLFINRSKAEANSFHSFYAHASYEYPINKDFVLTPAFMLDYSNDFGTIFDLGAMCHFRNYGGLGFIYRPNRMVAINLEASILPSLVVGYSYDINTGKLNSLANGSHEISLSFRMERFWGNKK